MKTLILTRHAKSSWSDPGLDDFDRPLNGRGRKSASVIGQWLAHAKHIPDETIVSGARRTIDTWTGVAAEFPRVANMRSEPALYHASAPSILAALRGASGDTVMLIGHNPGIGDFADQVIRGHSDHSRFSDFPTCATAVIQFEADAWTDVDWESGDLADFIVPRDLLS